MSAFLLHPKLASATILVGSLHACDILLMNNANFPWLILVPRQANARELHDLYPSDYAVVMNEVRMVSKQFAQLTGAYKMNVAALGNMVEQLHIHVIARFENDAAWPQPVWNAALPPKKYDVAESAELIEKIRSFPCFS